MSEASGLSAVVQALVAEATEWRLIELLFRCPSDTWRQQVDAVACEVKDPLLSSAARLAVAGASEGAFHSIFGPGGPAPAREASYHGTIQLGYLMAELTAYYNAFAYSPAASNEPIDHVSVEAGFIGYLKLKQAFALNREAGAERSVAAEAADRFIREHLSAIAEPMSMALDQSDVPYLELAGKALLGRTGPPPQQMTAILDHETDKREGCLFDCGGFHESPEKHR